MTTGKFIGINQRVPFNVLDTAILQYLESGTINKNDILAHMKEFTKGENRAMKATKYAVQILTRQSKVLNELKKKVDHETYLKMRTSDRKALVLCLVSLTYPITYDLLVALAAGFKVQNQINKAFINQKVAAIYGSNRTMDIALDALLPMIIELDTVKRDKISLYSKAERAVITNPFIQELITYTDIKLSGSKSILLEDVSHRPWYMYFEVKPIKEQKHTLLKYSEGVVGGGYLTI
jgi:hypothetical protein